MAKPASGKKEVPTIDKADTKKMFAKAKKKPINVGVCKASDGSILLLMHKSKRGPAMKAELEKEFGKDEVDTPRWGTAFIDAKADSKLVILDMNKPLAGAARKLKKALKGTGVSKIRYMVEGSVSEEMVEVEPGDENEPEIPDDDEDDENETENENDNETVASNDQDAGQTRNPEVLNENENQQEAPAQPVAQEAAPQQPEAPAIDVNALTRRLTDLVKRMMPVVQNDPSRQAELTGLAKTAQAAVKGADPQAAEAAINALEQALAGNAPAAPAATAPAATAQTPPPAPPAPPMDPAKQAALAASPKIWNDTISVVSTGIGALKDAIRKDFADEAPEVVADIEKNLARIDAVTARFDKTLADLLDGVNAATDEAARQAGLKKAKAVLADHIKYAASEPLIGMIDQNPFGVSPDIKKTLVANLTQLANAIR